MERTNQNPLMFAIVGDICGSRYEKSKEKPEVPDLDLQTLMHEDCHFTDDTVHTVAIAGAILENYECPDFGYWLRAFTKHYPNAAYGRRFIEWVKGNVTGNSFGNGAYMRLSPVLFAYSGLERFTMACASIGTSHNHPKTYSYLQEFICEGGNAPLGDYAWTLKQLNLASREDLLEYAKTYKFDASCPGSIPEAVAVSEIASSYEDCLKLAISLKGDTDTQACIAGYRYALLHPNEEMPQELYDWAWNKLPEEFRLILDSFAELLKNKQG